MCFSTSFLLIPLFRPVPFSCSNADGSSRTPEYLVQEAALLGRIDAIGNYLLSEERIAWTIIATAIDSMTYANAQNARKIYQICHVIVEYCAHQEKYEELLGKMFTVAVSQLIAEPKWLSGSEWSLIMLIRDLYCRLVLGQALLPGGQGPAMECEFKDGLFIQYKNAGVAREGGGVLVRPSDIPRNCLCSLPGSSVQAVKDLEGHMKNKRSAKDQRAAIKDFLSVCAKFMSAREGERGDGVFGRVADQESALTPTKVTPSKKKKKKNRKQNQQAGTLDTSGEGYGITNLFSSVS